MFPSASLHCSVLSKISIVKTELFRNQKKKPNILKHILTREVWAVGKNSVSVKSYFMRLGLKW